MTQYTTQEDWCAVPGYEGLYEVSSLGRVRRLSRLITTKNGHTQTHHGCIKALGMRNGYHYLWLFRENIGKKCYAHELVAIAFIGPRPDGFQVHHINRNRLDNRPENLEYISASLHAVHHKSGEQNHRAELTEEDVILARNLFPEMRVIDIAKQLGKPYHAIWQAVHGNSWKHID